MRTHTYSHIHTYQVVFIGIGMNIAAIEKLLDSCLLTDAEMQAYKQQVCMYICMYVCMQSVNMPTDAEMQAYTQQVCMYACMYVYIYANMLAHRC
jgi:hypothetical protein